MRLPRPYEDTVTMASTAVWELLQKSSNVAYVPHLHYLAAGTETSMDNAKALSAYVLEALSHMNLPHTLSTFQVQHACAGGTVALFALCALLQLSVNAQEAGIVVCSDIAHYRQGPTAEITQGAGAVALLVGQRARLMTLDVSRLGHASRGVDDFFRPIGSLGARVRGKYSMRCYSNALTCAMADFASLHHAHPKDILEEYDYIVMHSPFMTMARRALHNLLAVYTNYTPAQIGTYMEERGIIAAIEEVRMIGNIYSGSVYFVLYCLLEQQFRKIGAAIVGKKVLICSYGSGYTMTVMGGCVADSAPEVIAGWDMQACMAQSAAFSDAEYRQWMCTPYALRAEDVPLGGLAGGSNGLAGGSNGLAGGSAGAQMGAVSARTGEALSARTGVLNAANAAQSARSAQMGVSNAARTDTLSARTGVSDARTGEPNAANTTLSARTDMQSARTDMQSARTDTQSARTDTQSARTGEVQSVTTGEVPYIRRPGVYLSAIRPDGYREYQFVH